jgi:Tfp pilus assembly protein PilO
MSRDFSWLKIGNGGGGSLWLRIGAIVLALLNVAAIYLYIAPPGGSRSQLIEQETEVRNNAKAHRISGDRLKTISEKVQLGGEQTQQFAAQYFLPRRTAFAAIYSEMLRLSTAAGIHERDRNYSEEPIEGSDDLTLLTINGSYQGTYADLMNFLSQVDHSDHLIILDQLTATPQQQGADLLNITMRFLAIIKEDGSGAAGPATPGGQQ